MKMPLTYLLLVLAAFSIVVSKGGALEQRPVTMPLELVNLGNSIGCQPYSAHYDDPRIYGPPFVYGVLSNSYFQEDTSAAFWCHKLVDGKNHMILILAEIEPFFREDAEKIVCFNDDQFCYGVRQGKILGSLEIEGLGSCGLALWHEKLPLDLFHRMDNGEQVGETEAVTGYRPLRGTASDGLCPTYYFEDDTWFSFTPD